MRKIVFQYALLSEGLDRHRHRHYQRLGRCPSCFMLTRKQTKPLRANADGARYCASSFFDFLKYKICLNMMLPYNIVHGRKKVVHFYSIFDKTFCEQTVGTLIRRRVLSSGLCLYCWHMPDKKDARLNVNTRTTTSPSMYDSTLLSFCPLL